jgi:hypothetical protein
MKDIINTYSRFVFGAALLGYALMSASYATHWHELSFLAALSVDEPREQAHGHNHHGVPFAPQEVGDCAFETVYVAHHNAPPSAPLIPAPVFRVLTALADRALDAPAPIDASREQPRAPPAA